jgi:hypothetical protein
MAMVGVLYRVFSVSPFIRQTHEVIDGLWLGAPECFSEIPSNETIAESINCSLVGDVLGGIAQY